MSLIFLTLYFLICKIQEREYHKSLGHFYVYTIHSTLANISTLILILWQKVRQTRIFAIVRVFPYYEEAKK